MYLNLIEALHKDVLRPFAIRQRRLNPNQGRRLFVFFPDQKKED